MPMKQTQTKCFEFSDAGLDFCSGSKNLFPDRFKKMLTYGYNEQIVSAVSISGDQVTLNYGGAHGYVADRVLKIEGGALASINGGEFRIDAVTTDTLTFTMDDAPVSVAGGFTTKIAPLGWNLVYEVGPVHIYRFKHIDETYRYIRLLFNNLSGSTKNFITPCVGKTYDPVTGFIDDPNAYRANAQATGWEASHKWLFETNWSTTHNNSNYTQGFNTFGRGAIIGSQYHLVIMHNTGNSAYQKSIGAVLPTYTFNYEVLDYPFLMAPWQNVAIGGSGNADYLIYTTNAIGVLGNYRITFERGSATTTELVAPTAVQSVLPSEIDSFNTTTASLMHLYDRDTKQLLGVVTGGLYLCQIESSNAPGDAYNVTPSIHYDADTLVMMYLHPICRTTSAKVYFAAPIEEVKVG